MDDIASLQIRVNTDQVRRADNDLKGLSSQGARAEKATSGLRNAALAAGIGLAGLAASAGLIARRVVQAERELSKLNVQLISVTGSSDEASLAFDELEAFARETPFDINALTESFIQLVNSGLDPSKDALRDYANIAAGTGSSLGSVIDLITSATAGSFSALEQIGILAQRQGSQVALTFRGVTTTIENSANEIEGYLRQIGEIDYGGAADALLDGLDQDFIKLEESWDELYRTINRRDISGIIGDSVRLATQAVRELNDNIEVGTIDAYFESFTSQFSGYGQDIGRTLAMMTGDIDDGEIAFRALGFAAIETARFISESFGSLPRNIRTSTQLIAVELGSRIDELQVFFQRLGAGSQTIGGLDRDTNSELEALDIQAQAIVRARQESIAQILNGHNNNIQEFNDNLDAANERLRVLREERENDRLGRFQNDNGNGDNVIETSAQRSARSRRERREQDQAQRLQRQRENALENLRRSLLSEEDALRESHERNLQVINRGTTDEARRNDLTAQLNQRYANELAQLRDRQNEEQRIRDEALEDLRLHLRTEEEIIQESYERNLDTIQSSGASPEVQEELTGRLNEQLATDLIGGRDEPDTYQEQLDAINDFYETRRESILNNVRLTEEQRTELEIELTEQRNERISELERARNAQILGSNAQTFGALAELAGTFAGEQSSAYRTLFGISKAFSVAQALVKTYQSVQDAYAEGGPIVGPALAAAALATGLANVAQIRSTNFSGAFNDGGIIPQGRIGLVGEFGPELVAGPANVRSRRETAEIIREGSQAAQGSPIIPAPQVNVRNVNVLDPAIVGDFLATDDGEELIMNVVQRNQRALNAA